MKSRHLLSLLTCSIFLTSISSVSFAQPAKAITSSRCNIFTFDANASYDPDNDDISYMWDFGDGITSREAVVEHIYENSGDYFVNLRVVDKTGLKAGTSQLVRVNIPPFASFTGLSRVCANQAVKFDASASRDDQNKPLEYQWNFGDGTTASGQKIVEKIYQSGGSYKVSLTVDDGAEICSSETFDRAIYVNDPPKADAGKKEIVKCVLEDEELTLEFDASKSSDVNNDRLTYLWDFGDGSKKEGKNVEHTFKEFGQFNTRLSVNDNSELLCNESVDFIKITLAEAPLVEAGDDVLSCPDEPIEFNGSVQKATGRAQIYWDFGDGESAASLSTTHRYSTPGVYQAILSVKDEGKAMCPATTAKRKVTINGTPQVSIQSQEKICLGDGFKFDAGAAFDPDGDELEYYWSFGDGTIKRGPGKVSHRYNQGGDYRVTVIVDDGQKTTCSTASVEKMVKVNTSPVIALGENLACCTGELAEFNASNSYDADDDSLTFKWDMGDGTSREGATTSHTYRKNGSYNVVLTIDDNSGTECSSATKSYVVQIHSKPVPVINVR